VLAGALLLAAGCAKYNTYYNAKRAFDDAEHVREEAIRNHQDPPKPSGLQKTNYDLAIQKAQKILDEYPGHSLTDDALFLQAKAWHRLEGYRMSIRKFDLLFLNFPATEYLEEALYLQGLNYLLIDSVDRSQEFLDRLARKFPDSRYQAETLKVSGDNAFALEQWEEAATAYRRYLAEEPDDDERDRIALKLAQCAWELDDYMGAAAVLQELGDGAASAEIGFRARLLRARVHVRIGDHELAETLLAALAAEADIYRARGEVRLVEAENLIAQGRGDDATPLLESMPPEWETATVKAQARDMLGYLYLERGDWEEARMAFAAALRQRNDLEDPERTRRLHDNLRDFMSADQALVDAKGADVPELKLLKANSLLFGFDRPREAATFYREAAADTAATATVAARSLYGAYIAYRDHLDEPDSAAIYAERLEAGFPDSPQAYEARLGGEADLLGYLLAQQRDRQAERLAGLSPEERAALLAGEELPVGPAAQRPRAADALRRRMVYLARRPNLEFPPTPAELALAEERRAATAAIVRRQAAADSTAAAGAAARAVADTTTPPPPLPAGAEIGGTVQPPDATPLTTVTDSLPTMESRGAAADTTTQDEPVDETAADEEKAGEDAEDEKKEKQKKKEFDLRSPRPAPVPGGVP